MNPGPVAGSRALPQRTGAVGLTLEASAQLDLVRLLRGSTKCESKIGALSDNALLEPGSNQ